MVFPIQSFFQHFLSKAYRPLLFSIITVLSIKILVNTDMRGTSIRKSSEKIFFVISTLIKLQWHIGFGNKKCNPCAWLFVSKNFRSFWHAGIKPWVSASIGIETSKIIAFGKRRESNKRTRSTRFPFFTRYRPLIVDWTLIHLLALGDWFAHPRFVSTGDA